MYGYQFHNMQLCAREHGWAEFQAMENHYNLSRTDRVAMGKYDRTEEQDMQIVSRVHELAQRYGVKMQEIALAWHWAKGVASPIVGATKSSYLDDAAAALAVRLSEQDIAYLEEPYVPHRIVGAIDRNPPDGVILLDEKK